jgi:hypothetical protein
MITLRGHRSGRLLLPKKHSTYPTLQFPYFRQAALGATQIFFFCKAHDLALAPHKFR